jgi:hypothetical protein
MKCALVAVVLLGCSQRQIDRALDCGDVRDIVEEKHRPGAGNESQSDRLRKLHYRDAEVRSAVLAMIQEPGFKSYSPERRSTDPLNASDRLAVLCRLERITIYELK